MSRSLGTLTLDLIAKTGGFEQGMTRAQRKTKELDNDFKVMVARLDKAALALGTFAAGAAAGMVALTMQTVKTMDATSKMADQIGVTTESLTGLRFAAQQFANVSDQTFDMALRRMTRRIEEAAQGSGGAKAAFEAMGLSAKELARLSADQQFMRIADAMQATGTQAQKLKNTMAIFDTEGMPLVNALAQGSEELEKNIELATRYGVVLSTQAAKSAEQFSTNLSRLGQIQEGYRQQLTTALLPALERASGYMLGVAESALEVGNSRDRLQSFSDAAVEMVDDMARAYAGLVEMGSGVIDLFEELDRRATVWVEPFKRETQAAASILSQSFSESILNTAREIDKLVGFAGGVMGAWEAAVHNIEQYFRSAWNTVLLETESFVNKLIDKINPMLARIGMEGFDPIKLSDDNFIALFYDVTQAYNEGRDAAKAYVDMTGRVQSAMDSLKASTSATAKELNGGGGGSPGGSGGVSKALSDAQKAAQAFRKEQDRSLATHLQSVSAIHDQARAIEDQIIVYGLGRTALEDLTIARLEEQAVLLRGFTGSQEQVEAIEREIEARQRLRSAMGSLEQKEAEKAAWDAWARDVEQIFNRVGQSLTDAIFDGGKSGKELLKDLFKGLTFNILINPVMNQLQGWVTNQLGGLFGVQNPQQGGGILGMAQNANTLYQAYSGGMASNLGQGIQWIGNKIGSQALQSFATGLTGAAGAAGTVAGITSVGAGLGASLGASIGTSTAAMASTSFSAALSGGAGASMAATAGASGFAGAGAALGAALPWVGGALAIGSLLGGGLFDREPTTRREQRTQVEYAGGLFDVTKVDDRAAAGADAAARAMAEQAVQTANDIFKQVGVDAAIDSFHAIMASSYQGDRDGVASGGMLRLGDELRQFGIANEGNPTIQGFGGWSDADTLPRLAIDVSMSLMEALQAAGVMAHRLDGLDIRGMAEDQVTALATTIQQVVQEVTAFASVVEHLPFANLKDLSFEARDGLLMLTGGLESFVAGQQSWIQNYLTEAERTQMVWDEIGRTLGAVNLAVPDTRAGLRELRDSLDLTTEQGREAYAAIMSVQDAFASVTQSADELAAAAERAAEEQRRIRDQARSDALSALSAAYNAVVQAGQAEIARLQQSFGATDSAMSAYRTQAQRLDSELGNILTTLNRGISDLRGQVDGVASMAYDRARAVISTSLVTGQLPQSADLNEALRVAQQGVTSGVYASRLDQQRAYATLANEMEALKGIAEPELDATRATLAQLEETYAVLRGTQIIQGDSLTVLEQQLRQSFSVEEAAREQISIVEQQLEATRQQYDALTGIDSSIKTLSQALQEFAKAAAGVPPAGSAIDVGGVGSGTATGPGSLFDRARAYYAMNPDVAAAFNRSDMGYVEFAQQHYELFGKKEGRVPFAVGTNYVPYDMPAYVHKGERIIPAADNRELMQRLSQPQRDGNREVVAAIGRLERRLDLIEAASRSTAVSAGRTHQMIDAVTQGGTTVRTTITGQKAPIEVTEAVPA